MATTRTQPPTPSRRPRAGQGPTVAQYDFFLLGVVSILVGLGLVMIFSASFDQSNRFFDRPTYYFLRQLQWLVVSVVVMLGIALVDFRILKRWSLVIMIGTVLLLLVVLVFGHDNLGARRHLFNNSVQPSEVAKLTIIIYIAYWLSSKGSRLKRSVLRVDPVRRSTGSGGATGGLTARFRYHGPDRYHGTDHVFCRRG